jgi:hypothetical protein
MKRKTIAWFLAIGGFVETTVGMFKHDGVRMVLGSVVTFCALQAVRDRLAIFTVPNRERVGWWKKKRPGRRVHLVGLPRAHIYWHA